MKVDTKFSRRIFLQGKRMLDVLQPMHFSEPIDTVLANIQQALRSYLTKHKPRNPNPHKIVLVGGGSGSAVVGRSLLGAGISHFTLIANVADTLRDKETRQPVGAGILKLGHSIPDVVDITKQLLHTTPPGARTKLHSFLEQKPVEAMRIGYLVLAALYRELGSLQLAIQVLTEALGNSYEVLAGTEALTELYLRDAERDGFLDLYTFAQHSAGPPAELKLEPPAEIAPAAKQSLLVAEYVIIGPGDLHFSVLPHFLVGGFSEALSSTAATVTIVANLTTRPVDTPRFTLRRLLETYDRYLPQGKQCEVIVNHGSSHLPDALTDDVLGENYGRFTLIRAMVASDSKNNNKQYVHDEAKLGALLKRIIQGGHD